MSSEFELSVRLDWKEMERVNRSAVDFLKSHHLTDDDVNRFAMVISELVENGIKYGSSSNADDVVQVNVSIAENTFTAQVTNPLDGNSIPYLQELDRTIQWVRGFQDPFEAYLERMKAISHEPPENNKSGLGIARITYEGRASIDFFIKDNSALNVSAVAIIDRPVGGTHGE